MARDEFIGIIREQITQHSASTVLKDIRDVLRDFADEIGVADTNYIYVTAANCVEAAQVLLTDI